jgi:hypothetical protein
MNRKSMITSIVEMVILFMVLTSLNIWYIYLHADDISYRVVVTLECVVRYFNTTVVIQFINMVRILKKRYTYVNNYLSNCISNSVEVNSKTKDNIVGEYSGNVTEGNTVNILYVSSRNVRRASVVKIYCLRGVFSELNYIVFLINGYYGVTVFALTTWTLVTAIVLVLASVEDNFLTYASAGYFIYSFILLLKMTVSCHGAASESDVSKLLVQKLLLDDNLETKCVTELKMFSDLLNTTKVEYSGCGFFVLNLPFLCSAFSMIFSYIIIMIQLK